MPESNANDWGALWREQSAGGPPIDVRLLQIRRWELSSRTRSETLMSLVAAVLFMAVIGLRLVSFRNRVPELALVAMLAWLLITLFWFRHRLRRPPAPDSLAATGVEHYRRELERRRDHLRNVWIWNGPLLAACITLVAVVQSGMAMRQLTTIVPLLAALAAWTAYGVWRRRRQAADLQREIDELPQR